MREEREGRTEEGGGRRREEGACAYGFGLCVRP
jgi:hypothetical protein